MVRRARCPTCKKPVAAEPLERPKDYPFCSERCRLLDLHRWLSEDYRIPVVQRTNDDVDGEGEGEA